MSWYRKHLVLPNEWHGTHIDLYVEGAYSIATYYLNGVLLGQHVTGYTSAIFRLDNVTSGINFGPGAENILAIYIDATKEACTGWWYEGGGLFRNTYLISTDDVHIVPHGLFASTYFYGDYVPGSTPADGMTVTEAHVRPTATVESAVGATNVDVQFDLYQFGDSVVLGHCTTTISKIVPGSTVTVTGPELIVSNPDLWTVARPQLHTIVCTVSIGGKVVDVLNQTMGLRSEHWDSERGLFLNEQPVKMRGFCNHESFAAVGMAVPDRINLFRLQSIRGMGGNAVRASHNPPNPVSNLKVFCTTTMVLIFVVTLCPSQCSTWQTA